MRALDKPAALGTATSASQPAIMVGKAVICGEFNSGGNIRLGVELNSAVGDAYKDVRLAGVIDEVEGPTTNFSIKRPVIVYFNNRNTLLLFRSSARFSNRDSLSRKLTQFGSRAHR